MAVNTLIIGEHGIGKTFTLKKLQGHYFPNPNLTVEDLRIITGIRGGLNFQENAILQKTGLTIILDDFHLIQPRKKELIKKISQNHLIIGAGIFIPKGFEHWNITTIPFLNPKQSYELIKNKKISEDKKKEIIKKARGNPGKLLWMSGMQEETGSYKQVKEYSGFDLRQITNYMLSARYFFMFTQQWQFYSLLSMIAYAIIGFNRRNRYR